MMLVVLVVSVLWWWWCGGGGGGNCGDGKESLSQRDLGSRGDEVMLTF